MSQDLIIHLIISPPLLVIGYLFMRFPPKKINHFYGYRTPRSMRSQEAWDFANKYSSALMFYFFLTMPVVQALGWFSIGPKPAALLAAGYLTVGLIALMIHTETKLKKKGF
ncbi:MAG TPA: SdpI family protein [Cyclobacteriaceae bacterium]|nr:SdpI family protein [Cyclobacteriaceae bacterium]